MSEERGNVFKQFITENIILRPPTLNKKDFKQIMYNYVENLIFIKKNNIANSIDDYIPCLFYRKKESNNFFIYFHGNSENIFQIEYYGLDFLSYLEMNVILVEYPGYFLDNNNRSDPNTFFSNSLIVYDWIKSTFKVSDNQIFVCGRSLGTSPAINLSSQRNPKALFLISAFTSIMNVGYDQVKILSEFCLEKIFNSINYIDNIKCPILFIHGKDDDLISYKHSEQLLQKVKKININSDIDIRPGMDHNNFDLKKDIIDSILSFCNKNNLLNNNQNNENMINNTKIIDVNDLYKIPYKIKQLLEAKIFEINAFEKEGKIEKKNVSFLLNIDEEKIAIIDESIISIYNDSYLLYNEIDLKKIKNSKVEIKSLYQMKNKNLICATKEGDIFIFEIKKKEYKIVEKPKINGEIYKIGEFNENNICLLSKNYFEIRDNTFMNINSIIKNEETFFNFCLFSKMRIALINNHLIRLYQFENNNNQIYNFNDIKLTQKISPSTFVGTDQYLIVGGYEQIFFYNINKNYEEEIKELNNFGNVTFISTINDQLLLASTSDGYILQITIKDNGKIKIENKFIDKIKISSILMVNYQTILISSNNQIDILSISREKDKSNNCLMF